MTKTRKKHENDQCGDPADIRYRATGRRIGKKQKIASDKCASIFGAAVNDFSEWPFDTAVCWIT